MDLFDRFRGSIIGLAIGDALGHPTEFVGSVEGIRARWGPEGVTGFAASGRHPPGTFTDDTQMSIAVCRALLRAGHAGLDALMDAMGEEFTTWSRSRENNRSPGGACMSGCGSLRRGTPWRVSGVRDSKGCGAAMRAAPIGLFFHDDVPELVRVAAAQSAPTHRHPTGYASSVAAASAVAWAAQGGGPGGLLDFVDECVRRLSDSLLAELGCESQLVERYGVREMTAALDGARSSQDLEADDVCRLLGGGWIGEEAVACALWCVLKSGGAFRESVLRGANSSGDSDSIACIAGSIAGAMGGLEAIPEEWVTGVEEGARLDALSRALYRAASERVDTPVLAPELAFFTVRPEPERPHVEPAREDDDGASPASDEAWDEASDEEAAEPQEEDALWATGSESPGVAASLEGWCVHLVGLSVVATETVRARVDELGGSVSDVLDGSVTHVVAPPGGAPPVPASVEVLTEERFLMAIGLGQLPLFKRE